MTRSQALMILGDALDGLRQMGLGTLEEQEALNWLIDEETMIPDRSGSLEMLKRMQQNKRNAAHDAEHRPDVHAVLCGQADALAEAIRAIEEQEELRTLLKRLSYEQCFTCDCGIAESIFDKIDAIVEGASK